VSEARFDCQKVPQAARAASNESLTGIFDPLTACVSKAQTSVHQAGGCSDLEETVWHYRCFEGIAA
jgi:hypothetical protein